MSFVLNILYQNYIYMFLDDVIRYFSYPTDNNNYQLYYHLFKIYFNFRIRVLFIDTSHRISDQIIHFEIKLASHDTTRILSNFIFC